MNKAMPFPKILSVVIETMEAWLKGEPVWPYAKIIETWGEDFERYHRRMGRLLAEARETGVISFRDPDMPAALDRHMAAFATRDEYVRRFGFAIPCAELLDELARYDHVVEVGAGSGYMTALMRLRGINVLGSDLEFRSAGPNNYYFSTGGHDAEQVNGVGAKTMARRFPDAAIFCSWPSLHQTWFHQLLKAMKIGQRLIVIREGACASEEAWDYLDRCFDEERIVDIPVFECMHDYAGVYLKKRQRAYDR